ncbi:MAG: lipopolysaccharide heptosyltransferase I [Thiomonas sp.]|nr:lipopolysaccharide heptosyltransferase I [Thiomonas sp.]
MRVLIVKTSSMGDVVHALPVVHDILAAHPGAQIDWLVEEAYADIVRAHPGVRRAIPLALRRWRKQFWRADIRQEWREWKGQLRAEPYDAVIDLQGLVKGALIARLARGPLYGLSWGSAREALAPLFYAHRQKTALHRTEAAVPRYRALVAWALHHTLQGKPQYGLSLQAERPAWLADDAPYALLLSATAKDRKLWEEGRWIDLGQAFAAQGQIGVFAWGNAAERVRAVRLADAVNAVASDGNMTRACVAPAAFGLAEWMRVLRAASVVVGVDTGLLYLAAAVGTPAVALYTGSSPHSVDFESAGPWRSLGDTGQQPAVAEVLNATRDVLAAAADSRPSA